MLPRQKLHCNRGTVFSFRSVPRCYKQDKLVSEMVGELKDCGSSVVVTCCCEKLVTEAGYQSGIQRKGNVRRWKPRLCNC
jgi:hypothetical protein